MATIAICIWPIPSMILSGISLGKRLRRRGHRVCLISMPEVEGPARGAGFAFEPVLGGLFPAGSLRGQIRFYHTLSRLALLREMRRTTRIHRSLADNLLASDRDELDQALDRIAPDLTLIYSDTPFPAVLGLKALRRAIPCAYVTPLFYHHRGPASPPLSDGLLPRPGTLGHWSLRWAWARFFLAREVMRRLGCALGLDLDLAELLRTLSRQAGGAGTPLAWDCFLRPMLRLPEFFLMPRALDLPIEPRDGSHWLGWSVDEERAEEPFPWEHVDPSRPLVYCSFGSQLSTFLPRTRQRTLLQTVIDAFATRPQLQLALATGVEIGPGDLDIRAPDAIVLERIAQLQVLRRARLMISHGGFNSIQECAQKGVPMIVFPLGYDQPGNAARVVHHGLGLRGDLRRASAEHIGRLIDAALADESMRQRCAAMAERSRDPSEGEAGMRALETLAKRP
jgi:UDP:flavonoid glycosyltransferase YjiC (YdhE family)